MVNNMTDELEMKTFIFTEVRAAKAFAQEHYFSRYDEKDPQVVRTCNPRDINHLRRQATEIPNPKK